MEENKPIHFKTRIKDIQLVNFELADISSDIINKLNHQLFGFEFSLTSKNIESNNEVSVDCFIKIFSDSTKETYLGHVDSRATFDLPNLGELIKTHAGLPNEILGMYFGAILASTRGMIVVLGQNNFLKGAIFPMINTGDFFKTIDKK